MPGLSNHLGAILQPPPLRALDAPYVYENGAAEIIWASASERSERPCCARELDGWQVLLTHGEECLLDQPMITWSSRNRSSVIRRGRHMGVLLVASIIRYRAVFLRERTSTRGESA